MQLRDRITRSTLALQRVSESGFDLDAVCDACEYLGIDETIVLRTLQYGTVEDVENIIIHARALRLYTQNSKDRP